MFEDFCQPALEARLGSRGRKWRGCAHPIERSFSTLKRSMLKATRQKLQEVCRLTEVCSVGRELKFCDFEGVFYMDLINQASLIPSLDSLRLDDPVAFELLRDGCADL